MTNKRKNNIEKAIDELENLFLLDLLPETLEEAQEILREAKIDTTELKEKGRDIFRKTLTQFDDDWRNIPEETLKSQTAEIHRRQIRLDLPRETLLEKIREAIQILSTKGLIG